MSSKISAAWPLKSLMRSLSLSGWGILSGAQMRHCRAILSAFADILPSNSAEGISTAYQLSVVSGYSERHTRRALAVLEELGLITWVRGGIQDGKPAPSFFRVVKRRLVEIIMRAKDVLRGKRAEHDAQTRARIADFEKNRKYSRRSNYADIGASLLSLKRGGFLREPHPLKDSISVERQIRQRLAVEREQQALDKRLESVEQLQASTGLTGAALCRYVLQHGRKQL